MINHPDDLVGTVLGSYKLTKLLGRGGMGAVYLAQDIQLLRCVAVKVLLPNIGVGTTLHNEYLIRFRREAAVIANLEHCNIVPIYEYSEQDQQAYLVMPYFAGGNLSLLLTQHGPLSLLQTTFYIDQAAAALDYAHTHGVIHRDLKPSNLLLQNESHLVLADFGIARIMQGERSSQGHTLTLTGDILGTPAYMAPEMALGKNIDARADVYELGVVLFEMLTGSVPFRGNTPFQVIEQHLQAPFPLLRQINPTIPASVDAVVQKAVAKRREDRYTSAGELARDLQIACYTLSPAKSEWLPYDSPLDTTLAEPTTLSSDITPGHQKSRPRHSWWMWAPLALVLVLAFGSLLTWGNLIHSFSAMPTPSVVSTPGVTPAQHAQGVVAQFFRAINTWDYARAYNLFKRSSTSGNSVQAGYCSLANGYALTEHDDLTYNGVTTRPDGTFKVAITVVATELFNTGTVKTTYDGYEVVDPNSWQITGSGHLERKKSVAVALQPVSLDSVQAAQAVIQRFHSDIAKHNYPDAYSQWGSAFHDTTKYCGFIEGYSRTSSESMTIDQAMPLNDGTVQVVATINATEDTGADPTVKSYHATYLLGQEKGIWRILQAAQSSAFIIHSWSV